MGVSFGMVFVTAKYEAVFDVVGKMEINSMSFFEAALACGCQSISFCALSHYRII